MHAVLHGSPGFCIQGKKTGSFQTVLSVSHTSRIAPTHPSPVVATTTLSRNWARVSRRLLGARHIG